MKAKERSSFWAAGSFFIICVWLIIFLGVAIPLLLTMGPTGAWVKSVLAPTKGAAKAVSLIYYIPLLIIALSALAAGIDYQKGAGFALANLFLALCVGFAEEIYFRGVVCSIWLEKGAVKAMVISSILFGLCHLMNVLGGAGLTETILQIFFALAYGVAFALIFIVSGSIWPCILLHAFHDGCSFLSADGSLRTNILVGIFQFAVMITYIAAVVKRNKTVLSRPAAPEEQNAVR